MERNSLIQRIEGIVEDSWNENKAPLLLSKLGNEAGGEVAKEARSYAGSLANFIEKDIPNVRIVKHSKIESLTGAVPKRITDNADDLLAPVQSSRVKKARFAERFWDAFRTHLMAGQRRHVIPRSATSPLQVLDLESVKEPPEGSLEIVRDLIDQGVASDETYRRIVSWIRQNDCKVEDFANKDTASTRDTDGKDLLRCLLESLDESDARRISLPLDIAQKLSRARP